MKIQSINPASNTLIKEFQSATHSDVALAVSRARKAFKNWSELPVKDRKVYFERLAATIQSSMGKLLQLIKDETGKLIQDGEAEVFDVIDAIPYYLSQLEGVKPDKSVQLNPTAFPATDFTIDYVPYGVIGMIMPWNFPFYSPMMFLIAALTAGNAVVLKPSEHSSLVGLAIQALFKDAGFPSDLVQVILGADETGQFLVASEIDKIFFVGSVAAGKDIIAHVGIKPVQVELGGNSAALVLEDADIELAANAIAWGGTYHSGQDCAGVKRIFVLQSIADRFVAALTDIVRALRPAVDYGPYITPDAMYEVKARITNAESNGAKVVCGGEIIQRTGNWLTPSVILHESCEIPLVELETFGNTLPIRVATSDEEAVRFANDTQYGLSASIYSRDVDRAQKLAGQIESGMVFINEPFVAIPGWDHWTGWKNSGFGTSDCKLMQCLKKKVLSVNKAGQRRAFWYPYPDSKA